MRSVVLALGVWAATAGLAWAQEDRPPKPPRDLDAPIRTPEEILKGIVEVPGRIGGEAAATVLEQPGAPLGVVRVGLSLDEHGSVLGIAGKNTGDTPIASYAYGVWVLMPDGTVRAFQEVRRRQPIAGWAVRRDSVTIRPGPVMRGDTVLVAVLETTGVPWSRPRHAVEADIKALTRR